jgi:glycosyltransferase involved in cell wall biosynthesis
MLGVVIPAHNEAEHLGACLGSLVLAALSPDLLLESVMVVVVLDDCSDSTLAVASAFGVTTLEVQARNVGVARALGAQHCLDAGARWLAFTDADTVVAEDWLVRQLQQGSDAVCGTVGVKSWDEHSPAVRQQFMDTYTDADGHRHIHGANLGVSAAAYRRAGGFQPLTSSEDVALVNALQSTGSTIAWSASPRVLTSARRNFRAPRGFGAAIAAASHELSLAKGARAC